MPYICVNLTGTLTDQQKDELKRGLGEKIALIPGKSEKMPIEKTPNHLPNKAANGLVFLFIESSSQLVQCRVPSGIHCTVKSVCTQKIHCMPTAATGARFPAPDDWDW